MRLADGGSGGVVACLGVGGLVDLAGLLGIAVDEEGNGGPDGVDIWVFDSRRPWNLTNLFGVTVAATEAEEASRPRNKAGVEQGELTRDYRPGKGGIIVFDDGDIQDELAPQKEAWFALEEMPDLGDDNESVGSDSESEKGSQGSVTSQGRKRKSWSADGEEDEDESDKENARPRRRQRSNSVSLTHSVSPSVLR